MCFKFPCGVGAGQRGGSGGHATHPYCTQTIKSARSRGHDARGAWLWRRRTRDAGTIPVGGGREARIPQQ